MHRPANATAVIGLQWGDEGKGKVVDLLAPRFDAVVRYNGGANAGHSVVVNGNRFALHLVPSGVLGTGVLSIIGNGVVVDPEQLLREIDGLAARGIDVSGVLVSDRAHVVMPYHKAEDSARERALTTGSVPIGTTGRGIGPAYADKVQRGTAIRMADLLRPDVLRERITAAVTLKIPTIERFAPEAINSCDIDAMVRLATEWGQKLGQRIIDATERLFDLVDRGRPILFEGANASLLDIDHGTFPFVTSSHPSVQGIGTGTGLPPTVIGRVVGVVKAYQTRVGAGPMPTELTDAVGERIRERGREYGTTTGRPRRCGWLDLVALRYTARLNGATELSIMLLDVLAGFDELRICTAYRYANGDQTTVFRPDATLLAEAEPIYETLPGFGEDITTVTSMKGLPAEARRYLDRVSEFVGVPISIVSVGPDRSQTILADRGANA